MHHWKPLRALRLMVLALAVSMPSSAAFAQQRVQIPVPDAIRDARDAIAAAQAEREREEAERQRLERERAEREAEEERTRVHTYNINCVVTQIITTPTDLRISCDQIRNRLTNTGRIYARDEYRGDNTTAYIDVRADPGFAAAAAELAASSYVRGTRIHIEASTRPPDRHLWATLIHITRREE